MALGEYVSVEQLTRQRAFRIVVGGAAGMAFTYLVGSLLGTTL